MKKLCLILALAALLAGCTAEIEHPSSLVLEGWIDAGGYPVVLIHKSLVLANAPDSARSLEQIVEDQLIPFGKVVISDGYNSVVLTGRIDTAYLPPYTYSSFDMTGEVGKQYTVTVTYRDFHATATTTIPPVARFDSLTVRSIHDERVEVRGHMSGLTADPETFYAMFIRRAGEKQFRLCPLGVFSSAGAVNGRIELPVFSTQRDTRESDYSNSYIFSPDTTYQLKLARIDEQSYTYWRAYNEQILTSGVLFVPVYKNIPSFVTGGIGYFSGLGSSFYQFRTNRDTTYRFPPK